MTFNIVNKRIIDWNAARYEQQFNEQLQYDLLLNPKSGEVQEWFDAMNACNEVEQLDALCDIYFVAIGGLWKLGLSLDQIFDETKAAVTTPPERFSFATVIDLWRAGEHKDAFVHAIVCTMRYANIMGLSGEQIMRAVGAVCDSNDTKPAVKTASDVKANVDKGTTYVPPTEALKAILAERA